MIARRQALLLCGCAAASLAGRRAGAAAGPFPMTEIAAGIHVRRGVDQDATAANQDAIANIGFIVGDRSAAVIDPGGSRDDGERLRASLRAVTDKPVSHVILSHAHPDHIFGSAVFQPEHPVFAGHTRLRGVLLERGEFYRNALAAILGSREAAGDWAMPSLFVTDRAEIDLGNRVLELRAHKPAHTDNDLTVFDRRTGTLWAADLLFVGRIPSLDGSLSGWLREMDRLRAIPAARAVPGHGPVSVAWPDGLADQARYLNLLASEIRAFLKTSGDIAQAAATIGLSERDRWALFDDYNGHNVTVGFKELEWE